MNQDQYDVVIIGAGLSGLTLAYYLKQAGKKVCLLEKADRTGGVIQTRHKDGFTFECGPTSGSMGSPEMAQLFDDLGEACQIEIANEASKARWIWKNQRWVALPSGLLSGIGTPLFRFRDKLRLLREPWQAKGSNPHESIADMVKRRMGLSFLHYAIDPFIGGIYAGNPETLVTKYALPKLYNLEQNYGSFIGGSVKLHKERRKEAQAQGRKKHPHHGKVFSTQGGFQQLIDALTDALDAGCVQLQVENIRIQAGESYTLQYTQQGEAKQCKAEQVVTTCGAYALKDMLPMKKEEQAAFEALRYAKVVQVAAGYKNWQGKALKAFGGLIPSIEQRNSLGILFPSTLFAQRSPEGGALLSCFLGGMRKPEMLDKSDEEIKSLVLQEIKETLQSEQTPDILEIFRYTHAIPQYEASSKERYEAIAALEERYPGLHLAGNIRDGIGMSDRVKQAKQLADKIVNTHA